MIIRLIAVSFSFCAFSLSTLLTFFWPHHSRKKTDLDSINRRDILVKRRKIMESMTISLLLSLFLPRSHLLSRTVLGTKTGTHSLNRRDVLLQRRRRERGGRPDDEWIEKSDELTSTLSIGKPEEDFQSVTLPSAPLSSLLSCCLQRYVHSNYTGDRLLVIGTGAISHSQLCKDAERLFSKIPSGSPSSSSPSSSSQARKKDGKDRQKKRREPSVDPDDDDDENDDYTSSFCSSADPL